MPSMRQREPRLYSTCTIVDNGTSLTTAHQLTTEHRWQRNLVDNCTSVDICTIVDNWTSLTKENHSETCLQQPRKNPSWITSHKFVSGEKRTSAVVTNPIGRKRVRKKRRKKKRKKGKKRRKRRRRKKKKIDKKNKKTLKMYGFQFWLAGFCSSEPNLSSNHAQCSTILSFKRGQFAASPIHQLKRRN